GDCGVAATKSWAMVPLATHAKRRPSGSGGTLPPGDHERQASSCTRSRAWSLRGLYRSMVSGRPSLLGRAPLRWAVAEYEAATNQVTLGRARSRSDPGGKAASFRHRGRIPLLEHHTF